MFSTTSTLPCDKHPTILLLAEQKRPKAARQAKPETDAARSFLNPSTRPGHKHGLEVISARPTVPELDALVIPCPPYELPAQDLSSASVTQRWYTASAGPPQRDPTPPPRTPPATPALPAAHPSPALLPPSTLLVSPSSSPRSAPATSWYPDFSDEFDVSCL